MGPAGGCADQRACVPRAVRALHAHQACALQARRMQVRRAQPSVRAQRCLSWCSRLSSLVCPPRRPVLPGHLLPLGCAARWRCAQPRGEPLLTVAWSQTTPSKHQRWLPSPSSPWQWVLTAVHPPAGRLQDAHLPLQHQQLGRHLPGHPEGAVEPGADRGQSAAVDLLPADGPQPQCASLLPCPSRPWLAVTRLL